MRITDFGSTWARCGDHTLKRAQGSRAPAEITFTLLQGTDGFSLVSSARICELYSGAPDPSYVCSIKGAEQRWPSPGDSRDQQENEQQPQAEQDSLPAKLWRIEHRWSPSANERAPATLTLRLLSLVQKDVLHVRSLRLLPAEDAQEGSVDSALPAAVGGSSMEEQGDGAAAAGDGAVEGSSRPPAAGLSQVESVRSMLGQLAAADGGGGGGGGGAQHDPKRALLAAIARSVLQQAPRPSSRSDGGGLELVPLAAACGPADPGSAPDQSTAQGQQQQQQQRGGEAGGEGGHPAAEGQLLRQVLGAVGKLEARVARLEEACAESNSLLRQLTSLLQQRAV